MYQWVAQLIIAVAMTVVSAMLAPKPKDADPSSLGEFQVPTAEEGRPISIVLGTCKVKAPNITWWGALRTTAIRRLVNAMTGGRSTIGHRYHLGMQHALSVGPIDALVDIVVGDKSLMEAGSFVTREFSELGADITISMNDLFGGEDKEGGLEGDLRFYFGSDTQAADAYLAAQFGASVPAWCGVCYAVLKDFYLGTSNYPKEWAWVLRGCPCPAGLDASKRNLSGDANPAYGIAHILTFPKELGGVGDPVGTLDLPTFQAAANTLYDEGFGISLLLDRAQSADTWIGEILRHIDGTLFTDPATGLTCLKLIRADYDPDALPEFTESDIQGTPEVLLAAAPDTMNRVVVRYVDRFQAFTIRTAQAQDAGNYWSRSEGSDTTMDFLALSRADLAGYVAAREMRALASPLAKGSLVLNRKGWNLRPGSPFKLSFAPQRWSGLVCRVTNIRYGTLGAGKITVEFAQDVFGVSAQAYAPPGSSGWTDPVSAPQPCANQALLEAPYWLSGEVRNVLAMGSRADAATLSAEVWTNEGAGYLLTGQLSGMTPIGLLSSPYSCKTSALDATGFTVSGGADLGQLPALSTNADGLVRGQNLAWFPATGEIISWTTATDLGGGVFSITGNLRGILDTVPTEHAAGDVVWFLSAGAADVQALESSSGTTGAPGANGAPGADGRGYSWQGTWNSSHTYLVDDTVNRNGSTYVCIVGGAGHDPATATTYWNLMAQKGADGTGVPLGGTTGQSLLKASAADGDVYWGTPSGGGGSGTWVFFDPDLNPTSPSAMDDEFMGSALDSKWTTTNWSSLTSHLEQFGQLQIVGASLSRLLTGAMQALPAGDFTVVCKAFMTASNDAWFGLAMADGVTVGSGNQLILIRDVNGGSYIHTWSGYNSIGSGSLSTPLAGINYLRITRSGSTYSYYHSTNGTKWNLLGSASPGFTPTHIGIQTGFNGTACEIDFEYFRYYNSATPTLGGFRTVVTA